jgi:hypothetical protein
MLPYNGMFRGRRGYGRLLILLVAVCALIWLVSALVMR